MFIRCVSIALICFGGLVPSPGSASTLTILHSFEGGFDSAYPTGALTDAKGVLFGTANGYDSRVVGGLFKIQLPDKYHEVRRFKPGGDNLTPGDLTFLGGVVYGTSPFGGAYSQGAIYTYNTATRAVSPVYNFGAQTGDGAYPVGAVIKVKGLLYGVTISGTGNTEHGTLFSIDPATGIETTLHVFQQDGSDGFSPGSGPVQVGPALFGTTANGGDTYNGAIYKYNVETGVYTVVYRFAGGTDGSVPEGSLIELGGALYGTTTAGGASGNGTVFKIDIASGAESVVYSFAGGADGRAPQSSLTNVGGTLYGTTKAGGSNGTGTIFALNPATGVESVVYTFGSGSSSDGTMPEGALLDVKGTLYGTTYQGGVDGYGTVFAFQP